MIMQLALNTNIMPVPSTVSGRSAVVKRDVCIAGMVHRSVSLDVYQCYYADCWVPLPPDLDPDSEMSPEDKTLWSDRRSWEVMEEGWGGNYGNGSFGPPGDYVDIMIPAGMGKYKMHYYTVIQSIIQVWALNTGTTRNW